MPTFARIAAIVALILWPAIALANVPPPENEPPPVPAEAPADPNAPTAVDAPPEPSQPPPAETTPVAAPGVPPETVEVSGGPNMGMIVGVIAFLAVAAGAGYWFVNRNRA